MDFIKINKELKKEIGKIANKEDLLQDVELSISRIINNIKINSPEEAIELFHYLFSNKSTLSPFSSDIENFPILLDSLTNLFFKIIEQIKYIEKNDLINLMKESWENYNMEIPDYFPHDIDSNYVTNCVWAIKDGQVFQSYGHSGVDHSEILGSYEPLAYPIIITDRTIDKESNIRIIVNPFNPPIYPEIEEYLNAIDKFLYYKYQCNGVKNIYMEICGFWIDGDYFMNQFNFYTDTLSYLFFNKKLLVNLIYSYTHKVKEKFDNILNLYHANRHIFYKEFTKNIYYSPMYIYKSTANEHASLIAKIINEVNKKEYYQTDYDL